eukprot:SAG11_NODE_3010_length_2766_cov_13.698163_4_plen_81_part_00
MIEFIVGITTVPDAHASKTPEDLVAMPSAVRVVLGGVFATWRLRTYIASHTANRVALWGSFLVPKLLFEAGEFGGGVRRS